MVSSFQFLLLYINIIKIMVKGITLPILLLTSELPLLLYINKMHFWHIFSSLLIWILLGYAMVQVIPLTDNFLWNSYWKHRWINWAIVNICYCEMFALTHLQVFCSIIPLYYKVPVQVWIWHLSFIYFSPQFWYTELSGHSH